MSILWLYDMVGDGTIVRVLAYFSTGVIPLSGMKNKLSG